MYSKWFNDYKAKTGVQINYQSIGSGFGVQQITAGTVDFGASDMPMTDMQIEGVPGQARDGSAALPHRAGRGRADV